MQYRRSYYNVLCILMGPYGTSAYSALACKSCNRRSAGYRFGYGCHVKRMIMKQRPRRPDESFFSGGLLFKVIFRGIMIGLCTLGCFTTILRAGCDLDTARTGALATLIFSQLIHVFECKSEKKGIFGINIFQI